MQPKSLPNSQITIPKAQRKLLIRNRSPFNHGRQKHEDKPNRLNKRTANQRRAQREVSLSSCSVTALSQQRSCPKSINGRTTAFPCRQATRAFRANNFATEPTHCCSCPSGVGREKEPTRCGLAFRLCSRALRTEVCSSQVTTYPHYSVRKCQVLHLSPRGEAKHTIGICAWMNWHCQDLLSNRTSDVQHIPVEYESFQMAS